ncbi:MAG: hypothetical protein R2790_05745 [Flavobacterium haoranii]
MKNNYILSFFFLISLFVKSQTPEQVKQIIANYDLKKGEELYKQVKARQKADKEKAITFAKKNNIPVYRENKDGSFDELMYLLPSGEPIYFSIDNAQLQPLLVLIF